MTRLLGPDDSDRLCYTLSGSRMNVAAGATAIVYADAAATVRADILFNVNGVPGAAIPNSQVTVDQFGLLPRFWYPPGDVSSVFVRVGAGPLTQVDADFDARLNAAGARVDALDLRFDDVLPLAGGVLSGPITVLPGSSGPQTAIAVGDGSTSREIWMRSSYAGGQDTAANDQKFDSTSRIVFDLYQQAFNQSYGEPIRFRLRKADAKAAITWQGPTSWTAWTPDPGNPNNLLGGDPVGSDRRWAWIVAHHTSNDHESVHGHLSIELPDTAQTLQTRLEFPIWAPDGTFGTNQANIKTNLSHLTIRASNSVTGTPNFLRVAGSTTYPKYLEFSLSTEPSVSPNQIRWQVGVTDGNEAGSSEGSNFTFRRHADGGAFAATALFLHRATGNASFGSSSNESARVAAVWSTDSHHGFVAKPSVALNSTAAYASVLQTSADRVGDHRVVNDTSARVAMFLDKIEWGPGNAARDVNLYRASPDVLRTDDSFVVGPSLAVNGGLDLTSVIRSYTDGGKPGLRVSATADGTASLGVLVVNPFSASKRAIDVRLAADTVSRWRVEPDVGGTGAMIVFGDGTASDTNLFRAGVDHLKTDDSFTVGGTTMRHLGSSLGFFGVTAVSKPAVTGSRAGNAALASLLTALANLGLVTNSSSA